MLLHRDRTTPDCISIQITLTQTNLNMNEWGFVQKIKTFEQGRLIFSYAGYTQAMLHTSEKDREAAKILFYFSLTLWKKLLTVYLVMNNPKLTDKHKHVIINKYLYAENMSQQRTHWSVWTSVLCVLMAEVLYIEARTGKAERAEEQRGGKLAVTEKMRI